MGRVRPASESQGSPIIQSAPAPTGNCAASVARLMTMYEVIVCRESNGETLFNSGSVPRDKAVRMAETLTGAVKPGLCVFVQDAA